MAFTDLKEEKQTNKKNSIYKPGVDSAGCSNMILVTGWRGLGVVLWQELQRARSALLGPTVAQPVRAVDQCLWGGYRAVIE